MGIINNAQHLIDEMPSQQNRSDEIFYDIRRFSVAEYHTDAISLLL